MTPSVVWTRETIATALREAAADHDHGYWTQHAWAQAHRTPSVPQVLRVWHRWGAAWEAAGYPMPRGRQPNWTLETIQDLLTHQGQAYGRALTMAEWDAAGVRPSAHQIFTRFGSWQAAWNAAGFALPPRWQQRRSVSPGTWSRDAVLAAIRNQARPDGTIMNACDWDHHGLRPTRMTIAKHCESYEAAVQALGLVIVSDQYRRAQATHAEWRRAFDQLTAQLGHGPSRREWDAWPEKPTHSRRLDALPLPFRPDRGALYESLQTVPVDAVADPQIRAWLRRYLAGESLATIARDASCTRETIRRKLLQSAKRALGANVAAWDRTTPVEAIDRLSTRTRTCLRRAAIGTLGDLQQSSDADLLRLRNFGVRCLHEVHEVLGLYVDAMAPALHQGRANEHFVPSRGMTGVRSPAAAGAGANT